MVIELSDIVDAIVCDRVRITDHAVEEAAMDRLSLRDIYASVRCGTVIETYPHDRPYPSGLIYGNTPAGEPVHSGWAYNPANRWAVLVTVYRPDPERWIDGRIRRRK